jgi:hypothetical protein
MEGKENPQRGSIVANELLPPPELEPTLPEGLTSEQRIALWADLVDACEQFLLAGLRRQVGPDGDVWAAYRQWYAEQMEEHDRTIRHMLEELCRREGFHAR